MATAAQLASYTSGQIFPLLASTAKAAASFCNQGADGKQCTMWWATTGGPLTIGVGQQMSALNVFNSNLMQFASNSIATSDNGGTSKGDPSAGTNPTDRLKPYPMAIMLF